MDMDPAIVAVSVKKDVFLSQSESGRRAVAVDGGGDGDHNNANKRFLFNPQASEFTPTYYYMQPTSSHETETSEYRSTTDVENANLTYYHQPSFQPSCDFDSEQMLNAYASDYLVEEYYHENPNDQYESSATIPTLQPFILHQNGMKMQSPGILPTPPVHMIPPPVPRQHQYNNPEINPQYSSNINTVSTYAPRASTPIVLTNPSSDGQMKISQYVITPSNNNSHTSAVYGLLGYVPADPSSVTFNVKRKNKNQHPMPQQGILFPGSPPNFVPINTQQQLGPAIPLQPPIPTMPAQVIHNINHPPPRHQVIHNPRHQVHNTNHPPPRQPAYAQPYLNSPNACVNVMFSHT